jgi:glycosyltransferase involved in cell wall biosynthesis
MKILFCTNAFENITNGPAKFANLILDINRLYPGHQLRVLTEDVCEERLLELRYVHKVRLRIPVLLKPLGQILRMFQYYRQVTDIEREFPFDVLVYNNAFTGLYASLKSAKPTVGMINDDNNSGTGLFNFNASRLWAKRFVFKQLEKISTRHHRCIITNSVYLTEQVQLAYRIPPGKIVKLYKSVDFSTIRYLPGRRFESPIKVLFVKTDFMRGGLPVLARALRRLSEFTFLLTVVGPQERYQGEVEKMFAGVSHVELDFRGEQPPEFVKEKMCTHDLFCVPALKEALGVANMEALASGIPVVSTRVGGIPEVLDRGNNGWLVEPGNPKELADAIRDCIASPDRRRRQTENGLQFIRRFSKEEMYSNLIKILEDVVNSNIQR